MTPYSGDEVVALYKNGHGPTAIMRLTGYASITVYRMLSEAGVIKRKNGSGAKGAGRPDAKLTDNKVIELRQKRAEGMTYRALGELFGVSSVAAWKACHGSWSHVTQPTEAR